MTDEIFLAKITYSYEFPVFSQEMGGSGLFITKFTIFHIIHWISVSFSNRYVVYQTVEFALIPEGVIDFIKCEAKIP